MEELEDEGFVSIGTAFQYLETDEDVVKAKEKKEKELYVLDKQGRRRFHGAFTGGFSAGYFMSVGSKEGWSPAPFVSSRSQKASQHQQRPEDYMDDEDLDHFGIAPRQVATKAKFTQEKLPELHSKRPAVIPGDPLLNELVVPTKSTIGAQLMKSMGWREGKGVGPTSTDAKVKVYGCSLPGSNSGYMELAPNDISYWDFTAKSNIHGIGYSGMTREHFTTSQFSKGVYGMSGQAFGVGALEDDDDDIFSHDSIASYHTSLKLPSDTEQSSQYGWTGGKEMGDTWSLASFTRSSTRHSYTKVYPPPIVPRGFVSFHKFIASSRPSAEEKPLTTATERGYVTGERSVFDLISLKDRERLKMAKEKKQFEMDSYQPFSDDPEKQSRYESYLQGARSRHVVSRDSSLTEWEREKEMKEFDRLARVHKPLTTALTDRFTKATEQEEPKTAQVNPADVEMFGLMTRELSDWYPHRVLCKRFNIPDPYPNSDEVGVPNSSKQSSSINWRQNLTFEKSTTLTPTTETISTIDDNKSKEQEMETETVPHDTQQTAEEEDERPSVTLLKSIFAESSSDEDDDDRDNEHLDKPRPPLLDQPKNDNTDVINSNRTKPHPPDTRETRPHLLDTMTARPHPPDTRETRPHPSDESQPRTVANERTFSHKSKSNSSLKADRRIERCTPDSIELLTDIDSRGSKDVPPLAPRESREKRWNNLAEMIKPTLSEPQKLEEPLVYVKESFGPTLPPSLLTGTDCDNPSSKVSHDHEQYHHGDDSDKDHHVRRKDKHRHKTQHRHKDESTRHHHHHHKTKRKHKHDSNND